MKRELAIIIILTVALVGLATYWFWGGTVNEEDLIFCTQEAKLCPDGSYVGRTGPNCEFAACPMEQDSY